MRGNVMPFSPQALEEKPYNICISCPKIGQSCDGPNFLAMSVERWCEWCRFRKEYLGWKNSGLAEKAGVSKVSVDRIMVGDVKDLRITTMQSVTKALVNGSWGQSPCVLVAESEKDPYADNPAIVAQCNYLQATLERITEDHKQDLATVREEAQRKINFLRDQITQKDQQINNLHDLLKR